MTNTTDIADRIEAARIAAGMSREALSVAANIPDRTMRRRMSNPDGFTLAELIAITSALNVDLAVAVSNRTLASAA